MNIKVILNYAFLFLIAIGLTACGDENDINQILTYDDIAITFSGNTSGNINEEDTTVTGTVSVNNSDSIVAQSNVAQTYGSFSIDSAGQWTYTLDNANAAVQALNAGETVTESISIASVGGNTSSITITVTGVNDDAVLGGVNTGSIASNSTTPLTGSLSITDPDATPDTVVAQTDTASTYGTFSITEVGAWTYTLDTSNSDVQALSFGASLSDVIAVSTADGLTTDITITITGAATNTAATFSGDIAGSLVTGDTAALTGTVIVTDPDTSEDSIVAQASAVQTYGSFSIGTDGAWSYLLDNSNATVQALTTGNTLTDAISISSADGTMGMVTITINGPAPVATFAAVLQNADMQTYTAPSAGTNTNDLVDAWTVDPDNNFDNGMPTPFNFWRNDDLESWVSTPANNGGAGTTDKGSSSGTDAMSAGGTSGRSLKFDSSGERAYQAFEVETGIEYSLSAFVKTETTPVGELEGTFYILSDEPASDDDLASLTLVSEPVVSDALNNWQQASFSFTADTTFSFSQSRVDENTSDILDSTAQKFVIFYFVPTNTVTGTNEVFLTDIVISTPGF